MFTKISLSLSVVAFTLAFGASASDTARHYDKASVAFINSDGDARASNQASNAGPIVKHYDKASVAFLNSEGDARQFEASRSGEASHVAVVTESGGVKTQRGPAADVSFPRTTVTESVVAPASYSAPHRSSANKPAYYATHGE